MKLYKLNTFIIIMLSATIFSCASFSKKRFRKELENLEETNISKLNGKYSFYPIKRYYSLGTERPNDTIPDSLKYNNAYQFLVNESYEKKAKFNTLRKEENQYGITLTLENKNSLRFKVHENEKIIKDTILTGKHKNGMFYLDNKYLNCDGIPYLFGGCQNNKRRIGITKKGNLIINEAINNEGALLLIIGAGHSYNVAYEYDRK